MDAEIKKTIRGYELRERIGAGGFGAVYRAYQAIIDREVAIKVILPQYANRADFVRSFETEARLIARLEHPFIVPLFDYWREPDGTYLVMRFFQTGSLRGVLKEKGALPPEKTAQMLTQIAGALDAAHRNRVIHRDIKPENILLDEEGNAYLADFGIAKSVDGEKTATQEQEGFTGSVAYAAPETLNEEPATALSDIYSLGYVVYEMLTGKHAFGSETPVMLLLSHMEREIPAVEGLPEAVNTVLRKATAKDPKLRYPAARELAKEFLLAVNHQPAIVEKQAVIDVPEEIVNPYKGLRPFDETDAHDFFGRESLVEQLLDQLGQDKRWHNFLAVVGPSGSGKSSAVHAGLLPALRGGKLPGAEDWFIVTMTPGARPVQQLKTALLSIAIDPSDTLSNKLQSGNEGLLQAVENVLQVKNTILLVIDQFEEVFTLLDDEQERRHFLDMLYTAVTAPDSHLRIIITLRADFYDRPLLYENFGALMQARTQVILPLSAEELERAITGPARRVGLTCETDLVAAIVTDVREEPGALPLLQYALTEVFEHRDGKRLNLAAYQKSGGVLGALARRAEEVFKSLNMTQQAVAQQVFLRLVTPGEGTEDTRRRARYSELAAFKNNREILQTVLDAFGKYRLLTFDHDLETREPTIEVAHEALIREWGRLRGWLDNNRNDIRLQRMLTAAAADWHKANRDASYLLRGARLSQFEEWSKTSNLALSQEEQTFLDASISEHQRELVLEAERQARELVLERRSRQRLQGLVGILVLASIVGISLTIAIYNQSQTARRERDIAERQAAEANSLRRSTQAQQALSNGDTIQALSLALESVNLDNPPGEALDTLIDIAYAPGLRHLVEGHHTAPVIGVDISPDGQYALSVSGEEAVQETEGNQGTNQPPPPPGGGPPPPPGGGPGGNQPPPPGGGPPPDGVRRGAARQQPNQPADSSVYALILWNLETGEEMQRLYEGKNPFSDVRFLPIGDDGVLMAVTASQDGRVILWDVLAAEMIEQVRIPPADKVSLSTSQDGNLVLIIGGVLSSEGGYQMVWDLQAGRELRRVSVHEPGLWIGAISPDGEKAISGYRDGLQIVWDVETGEALHQFQITSSLIKMPHYSMTISPDGHTVVTNVADGEGVFLWTLDTGQEIGRFEGGTINTHQAMFNGDGSRLIIMSGDGVLRLWDITTGVSVRQMVYRETVFESLAFSADGRLAVTGSEDGSLRFWDIEPITPRQVQHFEGYAPKRAVFLDGRDEILSFGGTWVDNVLNSQLIDWNVQTGQPIRIFGGGHIYVPLSLAVSSDGRLALTGTVTRAPGVNANQGPGKMILWDIEAGTQIRTFELEEGVDTFTIAFDPRSGTAERPYRALAPQRNRILLWEVESGTLLHEFVDGDASIHAVTFTSDGDSFVAVSGDGMNVWDVDSAEVLRHIETGMVSDVLVLTPDDKFAVSGVGENQIGMWDIATGEEVRRFTGHSDKVLSFAFSSDGKLAISGAWDKTFILWDVATGEILQRHEMTGAVWQVAFSPDDSMVLSAAEQADMVLWRVEPVTLKEVREWISKNRYLPD